MQMLKNVCVHLNCFEKHSSKIRLQMLAEPASQLMKLISMVTSLLLV